METRQIDLWGGEHTLIQKERHGRCRYKKMQEKYGELAGKTCGTCANCVRYCMGKRSVFKCKSWIVTSSAATDIRLKDIACKMYCGGERTRGGKK